MSFVIRATIIHKASATDYQKIQVTCLPTDTLQSFRHQLSQVLHQPPSRIVIAYKGKLLSAEKSTLTQCNLIPSISRPKPSVFVTFKKAKLIKTQPKREPQSSSQNTSSTSNLTHDNLNKHSKIINNNNNNNNNQPNANANTNSTSNKANANGNVDSADNTNPTNTSSNTNQANNGYYYPPTSIDNPDNNNNNNNHNDGNHNHNRNRDHNHSGGHDDHTDEEKQCRICFGSDETNLRLGRLFSPCRCSGSMKYIHVGCLNTWRATAPTDRSYYRCDQCHYNYNLSRAKWADMVADQRTSLVLSVIVLIVGVLVFGCLTFKLPLSSFVYKLIEWHPIQYFSSKQCRYPEQCNPLCNSWFPWTYCPPQCHPCTPQKLSDTLTLSIDIIGSGMIAMGALGLYTVRTLIWRHKMAFVLTLLQSARIWRLFLVVGLGHAFYGLLRSVKIIVKNFLFTFGERILSVDIEQIQHRNPNAANANN